MATNLLLEGDDLEALLIKAHSEGGPNARIVRADKYRHGGLWGFFARERFEVAVEIPEMTGVGAEGTEGSAFFLPPEGSTPGPVRAASAPASGSGSSSGPDRRLGRHAAGPDPDGAAGGARTPAERIAERLAQRLGDELPLAQDLLPSLTTNLPAPVPPPARPAPSAGPLPEPAATRAPLASTESPAPAALAADGLLGIADRVNAAERAAEEAVRARYGVDAPAAIDLPADDPVAAPLFGELVAAGRAGVATRRATGTSNTPGTPSTATAAGRILAAAPAAEPRPAPAGAARPSGPARPGGVPHEPGVEAVRPSTSRPEFTALLDTLRAGSRPARTAGPAGPTGSPADRKGAPADHTSVGDTSAGDTADTADADHADHAEPDAQAAPADPTAPAEPHVHAAPADPTDAVTPAPPAAGEVTFDVLPPLERKAAPAPVSRIPAPSVPQQSELDDEDVIDPEVALRQNDPRTAADRTALRALGVPTAWTRRLRPGDRFAEVLRMLERMPEEDIDPATTVVAVVGSADVVRLEAHRTALDLSLDGEPRPVVVVPAAVGTERAAAVARALRSGPVVLAVEADGGDPALVLDTLTTVQAGAVIAVVDATVPLDRTQRWLDALGQVDALVLDGATTVADPAAVLQLGLPVVRLDGIPVDRVTWTALLCAQLLAAERSAPAER